MAKVDVGKFTTDPNNDSSATQYDNFSARPRTYQDGWVQPTAPPMNNDSTVTQQPIQDQQPPFLPMPEPGPVYRPPDQSQQQVHSSVYQSTPTTSTSDQQGMPTFLRMPEPGHLHLPPRQPPPQFQMQQPPVPYHQSTPQTEAPPGYYESQLAHDPSNMYRINIFKSMNMLNTLRTQVVEREMRLSEAQRKSELSGGIFVGDPRCLIEFEQEMNKLQWRFREAQQRLKELGENETVVPRTRMKKTKIHIDGGCKCCGDQSHYHRDICDNKPKLHIEGMCNSPDVVAQTCKNQNKHTGWIWGKQKIHIEGMWVSPKVHLKGVLFNPVIHVEGMWNKPDIHLEGICLSPEIHVEGMGVHPKIKITGLCHRLSIHNTGCCNASSIHIVGVCDQILINGHTGEISIRITGVCKNISGRASVGRSVKFRDNNDMIIRT